MEDVRKCGKCGADVDINDMYCPECGAEQPIRFHYEAYETSLLDAIASAGIVNLRKSMRLKSISLENNVLTISNLAGEEISSPVESLDQIVIGKQIKLDSTIIKVSQNNREIGIYAGGADLYPQDWEHILFSLMKVGAVEKKTIYAPQSTIKWQLIIFGSIFIFCVLLMLGAIYGVIDI